MAWALGHLYVLAFQPAAKGFCFISAFKTHRIFFLTFSKAVNKIGIAKHEERGPNDPLDWQERGKIPSRNIFKSMVGWWRIVSFFIWVSFWPWKQILSRPSKDPHGLFFLSPFLPPCCACQCNPRLCLNEKMMLHTQLCPRLQTREISYILSYLWKV